MSKAYAAASTQGHASGDTATASNTIDVKLRVRITIHLLSIRRRTMTWFLAFAGWLTRTAFCDARIALRRAAGECIPPRIASKRVSELARRRFELVFGQILLCRSPY
jgi:hypothetical protein